MAEQGFSTWHKLTTMWKTSWCLSHREIHDNPTTSKTSYYGIKEALLTKELNSFHSLGKKLDYLHLQGFPQIWMWIVLEATFESTTTQDHCAYCTLNHRFSIEIGQWTTIPISRDIRLCHFFSYNAFENEVHFVLECPLYNSIREKNSSLLENIQCVA